MVVECNWRSTLRLQLRDFRNALGGQSGEIIHFSPPLPFSLARGSWRGAYGDSEIIELCRNTGITEAYGDIGILVMD